MMISIQELEKMKKSELLVIAKTIGMKGFSRLTKSELIKQIFSFVQKSEKSIEEKLKSLIVKIKINPPKKSRTTRVLPVVKTKSKSSSSTTKSKPKKIIPTQKSYKSNEPQKTIDKEAETRTKIESMRYIEKPLIHNGVPIAPKQLRDVDEGLPELPLGYGDNVVTLLPRDPKWMFCYWDIDEQKRIEAGKHKGASIALRLHDVTHINFDGHNSWSVHQFILNEEARWWYIPVPSEGRRFLAEIGYLHQNGTWQSMVFSDSIEPPPGSPSPWIHDVFITLPFDRPLPIFENTESPTWLGEQKPTRSESYGIPNVGTPVAPDPYFPSQQKNSKLSLSSPALQGYSSFVTIEKSGKKLSEFPLIANADLRIFGATVPSATLSINGKIHKLDEDGSFHLSLPFPDGSQTHIIKAVNTDGEEKTIKISFHRNTTQDF